MWGVVVTIMSDDEDDSNMEAIGNSTGVLTK
jgi:hypothetical protein